jgi:arylsulfatase A-like enzyme
MTDLSPIAWFRAAGPFGRGGAAIGAGGIRLGGCAGSPHAGWVSSLTHPVSLVVWLALSFAAGVRSQESGADRPPNIVLILADDLGPEWIGCYGGEEAETPRIDRLAAEGLRYSRAWSMPKCTPTRVTLLTGQYPFRHGWVNHWDVPRWGGGAHFDAERHQTFARALQGAGYRTAVAGKWQIDDFREEPSDLERHGFEASCVWTGYEDGNPPSDLRYHNAYVREAGVSATREGAFGPDVFCDFLIRFAEEHRDEPFLLYYPMVLPHGPVTAPPGTDPTASRRDKFRAMVRHVDRNVGRLEDAIDELGLAADTCFVFTGDNGTERGVRTRMGGREVRGGKGLLGENGVHTPLVVRWPGTVEAGATTDALWDTTDVFPTMLGLAGIDAPAGWQLDGVDQGPVFRGEAAAARAHALAMGGGVAVRAPDGVHPAWPWADRAVRDARFKLVASKGEAVALHDLTEDPGEESNLVASSESSHVAARERLLAVVRAHPARDSSPDYIPLPDLSSPRPMKRPNVILLMADDLGYGDLGVQGHPRIESPHLDRLAADGLRFTNFHASAPVCSPTRAACLTGLHPFRLGVRNANVGHLPAETVTLQGLLRRAGYRTGHFGKWHLGTLTKDLVESNRGGPRGAAHFAPPWERGFEVCFSTEAKVPTFDPMVDPVAGGSYGTHYWTETGERATEGLEGDDSRVIVDRVEPFVRACAAAEEAFLAVVWFHAPHLPVVASAEDRAPFADLDEETQHYYGCIRALDREVGRVRALLEEVGVADDTVLWFCSDNGPEGRDDRAPGSTGGLRGRKRSLFEGGTRVPGILTWPRRVPAGTVCDAPVSTADYLPTIAGWAGLEIPDVESLDGEDLEPLFDALWSGRDARRQKPIGFVSGNQAAWIDGDMKLVARLRGGVVEPVGLFDLARDRAEATDVRADRPEVAVTLLEGLREFCGEVSGKR